MARSIISSPCRSSWDYVRRVDLSNTAIAFPMQAASALPKSVMKPAGRRTPGLFRDTTRLNVAASRTASSAMSLARNASWSMT